jgi:hypothetical protein
MAHIADWHYREQDGHPEIHLEPPSVLVRRTEFARLRGEGFRRGAVRDMLAIDDLTAYRYEVRRLQHVAAYEEMCSHPAWPGLEAEAG